MIRTYKRKLNLNSAQEQRLLSWIGACRTVYNLSLEIRKEHYRITGSTIHKYELMKQVTELRSEIDWMNDVPVGCLQESVEQLHKSYQNFFRGAGFPKFADKKRFKSIRFKLLSKIGVDKVTLPKFGEVKFFKDSEIIGTPKMATIIKDPTGFFICIVCDEVPQKFTSENQAVGLDMGVKHFCIDSNGGFIANPRHFKIYERRLRIENRSLARKVKGSESWKRQCKKLALLHHKIGNVRKDFLHKESTKIAKANSMVYVENLNIAGMSKNPKLAKHILDCGWGMFRTMLEYKTVVIAVDPKFTSQTCNECGEKDSKSRMSQSEFCCTSCGHVSNADVNAAKNIMSKGIALNRQRSAIAQA